MKGFSDKRGLQVIHFVDCPEGQGSYVSFVPNNFQVMQHWRSTGKLNIVTLVLLVKNVANNSKQLKIYWIIRGVTRHVSVTNVGNVSQP